MAEPSDGTEEWRDVVREAYRFGKWYLGWGIVATAILAVIVFATLWIAG